MAVESDEMTEGGAMPSLAVDGGVIGGSTGGASMSDLQRGYTDCTHYEGMGAVYGGYDLMPGAAGDEPDGFLDRPQGWER